MPTLKELQENTDEIHNPSSEAARSLVGQEQSTGKNAGINSGIDQAEAFANDPKNASSKNISDAKDRENQFGYEKSGTTARSPRSFSFKGLVTSRKSATGGIIGAILALVGGIGFIATPGLAVVQMKEILTDDLNDQLAAMDIRSTYVMRAKLNDIGKGVCTGIKIRCGFKGMSDKQLAKFKAAGFEVETDGKTAFGKNHIKSMSIKNSTGDRITIDNPSALNKQLGDRIVRGAVKKAFNPKFAGFFDAKWDDFKARFKLSSGDKIGAGTEEDKKRAVTSAVQGDPISVDTPDARATTNEDGSINEENQAANDDAARNAAAADGDGVSTKSLLASGAKGAVKGLSALGVADVACTIKNTARAVEAGAKIYRYKQLVNYAMVYLTFADMVKAGTATDKQAEFVGDTLTAVDTDEMIYDESSPLSGEDPALVKNPYYGANAFDSNGYKTAMYNEAPTLSARDMETAIGGGMALSMLGKVNDVIEKLGGKNCKIIQNWAVRVGGLLAGIVAGVITLGAYTAASVGASIAISMALPILENYLAQMTAGTVVSGETNGVDAGNAIFAGSAGIMGGMAAARGMKPANKNDLKSYLARSETVKNEYIAMESEEAKSTPFDVNNRYSFMGSLARTLLPLKTTSSVSLGNSLMNNLKFFSTALSINTPKALAASSYNEERYSKCKDTGYEELNIDADIFCNVRFTLSEYELGLDTEEVRVQMQAWNQVNDDEEGSVVADSDYARWLIECTEREEGWGENSDSEAADDGKGIGKPCVATDKRTSYYRVFTMDNSIIAAMDYIPPTGTGGLNGGSEFRIGSFNVRGASHDGENGTPAWQGRIEQSANVIRSSELDIVGFQEFEPRQYDYIQTNMPEYTLSSHGKQSDSIMWNNTKFSLVTKGTWRTTYFEGPIQEPWVKLKDTTTQQEFFVLNVHDPINRGQGSNATRFKNAKAHLDLVNRLKTEAPVLLVGDFNSAYSNEAGAGARVNEELTYCVLTGGGVMNDAYDLSVPRPAKCPNKPTSARNYIDHIYLTPEMDVTSFAEIPPGYGLGGNGSDHPTIFSDVVIPAATTGTGAGTTFTIGSYNQKGSLSLAQHRGAAQKIIELEMDVVGTQETTKVKYDRYKDVLLSKNYGVYPTNGGNSRTCSSIQSIFYNKTKFKFIKGETFEIPRYPDPAANCGNGETTTASHNIAELPRVWTNIPIIWLEDADNGQSVIVINTHNVANVAGAAGTMPSKSRHESAKIYIEQIKRLKSQNPGVPIVMTGDFNEGTNVRDSGNVTYNRKQSNLLFCMFASNGLMKSAAGPAMKCDPSYSIGGVDYIYTTPEVQAEWTREIASGGANSGAPSFSDHPVKYARLVVPGSGDGDGGGTGSDIAGNDYARECNALIGAQNCTEQCVAFVKFRLVKHGALQSPISLGNGKDVTSTLGRMGYAVNRTPAVHSVFSTSATSTPQWGHTGMVSAVNADGSIVVEEYNYATPLGYGKRTLTKAQYTAAGYTFAHTETKYR